MITLKFIKENENLTKLVNASNDALEKLGYTEHGLRHVGFVSNTAANILRELDYPARLIELAAIAGWLHDTGNAINRQHHGITGAAMLMPLLFSMGMPMEDVTVIIGAIGNHEEETGYPINEVAAALIIADKVDAHRTRVRKGKYDPADIHDRVNYAIKQNRLKVDKAHKIIRYEMTMENTSSVMDFMQIYLSRMILSEQSAAFLGCSFEIIVNNVIINNQRAAFEPNGSAKLVSQD